MFIEKIKSRTRGTIGWVVIVTITIPFVMFGVSPYVASPVSPEDLVVVGDRGFGHEEIREEIQIQRAKIIKLFGQDRLPDNFDEQQIFRMAIDEMVANELARQYGSDRRMTVGDEQLIEYIRTQPDLQGDDGFEMQKLNDMVVEQGINKAQFENRYRESIVRKQLETAIGQAYLIGTQDVRLYNLINAHRRKVSVLTLPTGYFVERADISEEEIAGYHQNHASEFMAPERLSLEYLMLDRAALIDGIEVGEEELRKAWEQNTEVASEEEKRKARHILISLPEDAAEAEVQEAFDKLSTLRSEFDAGASFADLAREHSDDPGSAGQGGDLGEVARGVMVKPFEEALFALERGQVSDIITTQFGLHLILLEEIVRGDVRTFDQMRDELNNQLAEEKSFQVYEEKLARLRELSANHPDDLETVAGAMSLEIQKTEPSDRGALADPFQDFDDQLFAPELIETPGKLSALLELPESRAAVARVLEHTPAREQGLEEVREQIVDLLEQDYAQEKRTELRLRIATRLAISSEFAALADDEFAPLERQDYDDVSRVQTHGLPGDVIDAIFSLRYPGAVIGLEEDKAPETAAPDDTDPDQDAGAEAVIVTAAGESDPDIEIENATVAEEQIAEEQIAEEQIAEEQIAEQGGADGSDPDPAGNQSETALAAAQAALAEKDFAWHFLSDQGLRLIVVQGIEGADSEALAEAQAGSQAQVRASHTAVSLRSFYEYLQEIMTIDLSGLQSSSNR